MPNVPSDASEVLPLVAADLLTVTCSSAGRPLKTSTAWNQVFGTEELWGRLSEEDRHFATKSLTEAARGASVTHQVFLVRHPEHDVPVPVLLHFLPVHLPNRSSGRYPVQVIGEELREPATWAAGQTRRRRTEMLGQMAMGVAHDFNNLLTTILGHAELMRDTPNKPASTIGEGEARASLRAIVRAASDGAALVRKIQQYIRHEREETFERVELHTLVDEVTVLTRPYWHNEPRRQGIAIELKADLRPVPQIMGNPAEIREVLVNLVLNAVQAMPAGGTLRLRTHREGDTSVIVEVEDTGVGMPESIRQHIFEPLFTTKGSTGTGMGLAVTHGIMQEHNGRIDVESEPGRGTLFRLVFPISVEDRAEEVDDLPKQASASPPVSARVLVVDDEPMVRTVTTRLLQLKGYEVDEAEGGRQALAALSNGHTPDLVLTDLSMPGMSGRELAAEIHELNLHIPVILLTGDTDPEVNAEHVSAVVKKPFKLHALHEQLQRALRDAA